MASSGTRRYADPTAHTGATGGDRPSDKAQIGNPHGTGVDDHGLPTHQSATAQDALGATKRDRRVEELFASGVAARWGVTLGL
jgi:hypothetical protein